MSDAAFSLDRRSQSRAARGDAQAVAVEDPAQLDQEPGPGNGRFLRSQRSAAYDEYWRPVLAEPGRAQLHRELCNQCGSEFALGANYCHICGQEKNSRTAAARAGGLGSWLNLWQIQSALGLARGPVVLFLMGIICAVAAVAVGFIYSATTLTDWQAVQVWRMEWLLAAMTAFGAGILLKK